MTSGPAKYYVSPSGSNSNSGTLAEPWQTIRYAASKLQAGETLNVRGGTYAEAVLVVVSGTAVSPITITAYPGETPIIDGAGLTMTAFQPLLQVGGNYLNVSGLTLRNANLKGSPSTAGYGVSVTGANVTLSKLTISNVWMGGVLLQGNNDVLQDSNISYAVLMNCRLSTASACGTSASKYGNFGTWPECVQAVQPYQHSSMIILNATIQRTTVHDCWGEGIGTYDANGIIIQDNVAYNNFSENLYVNNAQNVLVQRNIVYNANDGYINNFAKYIPAGFTLANEPNNGAGTPYNLASNNTVINNFVYNSPFCAFCWTTVPGTGLNNVLIANNTIVTSFGTGASFQKVVNKNSYIINNIVTGAVTVPGATGLNFANNLWSTSPPENAASASDVIGNPSIAQGVTGPGQLSASYFKLLATSPAIGKGAPLTQVKADFFGTTRKTVPDIGGHEQ